MFISHKLEFFFILCIVNTSLSSPIQNENQGRSIGSTIWSWITYPFSWWNSGSATDNEINFESTSVFTHDNNMEISKHNVTVWCSDQTCTTMKCDKNGCTNITCNIYDTDMSGLCREYTIKPEESTSTNKPITQVTEMESKKTTETTAMIEVSSSPANANINIEERPIELEAVLSSTVPINNDDAPDRKLSIKD